MKANSLVASPPELSGSKSPRAMPSILIALCCLLPWAPASLAAASAAVGAEYAAPPSGRAAINPSAKYLVPILYLLQDDSGGGVNSFMLSVSRTGTGSGSVSSVPAGINCGSACSAAYAGATTVSLTATPSAGSSFSGWGGACSGTGGCSVGMSQARTVSAGFASSGGNYAAQVQVLDYQVSSSTITGITGVASCADATGSGTTCTSNAVAAGTIITLTANPASGYGVTWGGACASAGAGASCQLTMDAAKSVTASFDPKGATIWWVSKTGSDSNTGRTPGTAFATFRKALTTMAGGDTLYIDDGTYAQSIGGYGGAYSPWDTSPCGGVTTTTPPCLVTTNGARNEGPNGISAAQRTRILGYRRHKVIINPSILAVGKRIGLELFKGQHVEVGNIVFMHTADGGPVWIEQFNDAYLHQIGTAYPDNSSNADNNRANFYVGDSTGVVIEESWAWGYGGRYGIVLHGGTNNVARRNVIRYDGAPDGNPRAGISLYSEDNSLAENNIVIDFDHGTDTSNDVHAPLFATSSVPLTSPSLVAGLASIGWYGNVAVNVVGNAEAYLFLDSLSSAGGTITMVNNVMAGNGVAGGSVAGLWMSNDNLTRHNVIANHNTIYNSSGRGVRVDAPPVWNAISFNDNLIAGANNFCFQDQSGAGTRISASHNQVFGCTTLSAPNDASLVTSNPGLTYLLRVDAGAGKGTASDGGDRGATVVKRYQNGVLTANNLWPFPNEDSILADMCAGPDNGTTIKTRGHNQSGWCASGKSLTRYVWEQLGNASPY